MSCYNNPCGTKYKKVQYVSSCQPLGLSKVVSTDDLVETQQCRSTTVEISGTQRLQNAVNKIENLNVQLLQDRVTAIEGVGSLLGAFKNTLDELKAQVESNGADDTTQKAKLQTLEASVATLETSVNELNSKVPKLESKTAEIEQAVNELKEAVKNIKNQRFQHREVRSNDESNTKDFIFGTENTTAILQQGLTSEQIKNAVSVYINGIRQPKDTQNGNYQILEVDENHIKIEINEDEFDGSADDVYIVLSVLEDRS